MKTGRKRYSRMPGRVTCDWWGCRMAFGFLYFFFPSIIVKFSTWNGHPILWKCEILKICLEKPTRDPTCPLLTAVPAAPGCPGINRNLWRRPHWSCGPGCLSTRLENEASAPASVSPASQGTLGSLPHRSWGDPSCLPVGDTSTHVLYWGSEP